MASNSPRDLSSNVRSPCSLPSAEANAVRLAGCEVGFFHPAIVLTDRSRLRTPCQSSQRSGRQARTKEARYPDESYDEEDEGQENSKEPKAPTFGTSRPAIAPKLRHSGAPAPFHSW